ncbi:MAG: (Fe-S)-binding protein [Candidatus Lokiarchaeota archaeon]|nr:(Fe-S)-binding protein [Candidatus Lokiarchaeota archaeon]
MSEGLKKLKKDLRRDVYQCSLKCFNCMYINPHYLISQDFYMNCPAGKLYGFDSYFSGGRMEIARGIIDGTIKLPDEKSKELLKVIYACTTCGSCENVCFYNREIKTVEVFETIRQILVEQEIGPMPEQVKFLNSINQNHNPYQEKHEDREKWIESDEELKNIISEMPEQPEVIYYVGCTSSYRTINIAKATAKILKKLNVLFKIIFGEEWCCGSPAARVGDVKLALRLAKHNIEEIEKTGAKKVIFSCAGCYRAFKKDYNKWGLEYNFEVQHVSEYIANLIEKGKIKLKTVNKKITYHDPCHLGRHLDVYDEPRIVINAIPGIQFIEMARNRFNAWCCGSGGGVKAAFKDLANFAAAERIKEAKNTTNAVCLVSTCPFCYLNLKENAERENSELEIMDLMEIILEGGIEINE